METSDSDLVEAAVAGNNKAL
ncbi:MAG: hypothetical protein RL391_313, partial [Actinomycetota bacterium]